MVTWIETQKAKINYPYNSLLWKSKVWSFVLAAFPASKVITISCKIIYKKLFACKRKKSGPENALKISVCWIKYNLDAEVLSCRKISHFSYVVFSSYLCSHIVRTSKMGWILLLMPQLLSVISWDVWCSTSYALRIWLLATFDGIEFFNFIKTCEYVIHWKCKSMSFNFQWQFILNFFIFSKAFRWRAFVNDLHKPYLDISSMTGSKVLYET